MTFKRRNYFVKKKFQLRYTLTILVTLLAVMFSTGLGIYLGLWGSIIENFNEFKVSQDLETAKRLSAYEDVRYKKGDYRLDNIFREAELLSAQQQEALGNALRAVNRSVMPKLIALMALIFVAGIFLSHKIAGPMYRFESSAEAVREGNLLVHFKVRKGDEMSKTGSSLEEMIRSLRVDMMQLKSAAESLKTQLSEAIKRYPAPEASKIADTLKEIIEILSKYKT